MTRAAIAVLGDLADALGQNAKILLKDCSFYAEFIHECLESGDEQLKDTALINSMHPLLWWFESILFAFMSLYFLFFILVECD